VTEPTETIADLERELASIHRVHIDDVRALVLQFEDEQAQWAEELKKARASECGALCNDIENDRDVLAEENQRLHDQGVPGVMHETDRALYRVMVADRDRFAALHRNLAERQRRLIGEFRASQYATRLVGEVEALLSVALGRPGAVNRDNLVAAAAELVKERDHHREQVAMWASPHSNINRNERIVAALQQKIGEAVGTDVGRDQMVEMFDHLVSQYRTQSADQYESMQYTIGTQRSTIDTQLEDLIVQKRIAEAQAREVKELAGRHTEMIQRALAAEGQVRRMADEATREEARRDREIGEAITMRDDALAEWSRRYNGLESASQAVGHSLTLQIRRNDQLRSRLRVADDLLHEANGVICNAENLKMALKCMAAHCVEGDHVLDLDNPVPIGAQDWRDAQRRWAERWHVFMDSDRSAADSPDPLDRFAVRAFSDGARELVQLTHRGCDPRTYPEAPGGIQLTALTHDAHWHMAQCHDEQPDEASPDAAEATDGGDCHLAQVAYGGDTTTTPTEVNE